MDKSPWMRRTRWLRDFAGRGMNEIVKKSWKSTKEEASLRGIWKSVKRVMNRCEKGVRDCADRNWSLILFWLNSCEDNKADIRLFNIDVKSKVHKSYTEYWQRFICYCMRTLRDKMSGIQYLSKQRGNLEEIAK